MTPNTKLIGFAQLDADTLAQGPDSGSALLNPTNGRSTPFKGQPVQGFSGVQFGRGGNGESLLFLSDNGFGAIGNSSDYLLRLYLADPSFKGLEDGDGSVEIQGFIQLSDPDRRSTFKITGESSSKRLLTGADYDIESVVIDPEGDLWIGDEFGPFLLHFDADGKLLDEPYSTPNNGVARNFKTLDGDAPLIIGHRGASGELPEHTLEAYRLAILRGADFIEPDLVATKDGHLIARHEPNLTNTTDVASRPEYANRRTTKIVDGVSEEGFFASDFTLDEIKTLRAVMPQGFRTQAFNNTFEVPTLVEIISLAKRLEELTGRPVGIYPETKHPTFHDSTGLSLEEMLIATLKEQSFTNPDRVFIQSFEVANLKELSSTLLPAAGFKVPLVQLLDAYDVADDGSLIYADVNARPYDFTVRGDTRTYADLQTPQGLAEIATYADGIGPWKPMIMSTKVVDDNSDGKPDDLNGDGAINGQDRVITEPSKLLDNAHAEGLFVHAYTFRNESRYLASSYANSPQNEYAAFMNLGVDGFFSDFPGTADLVRDQLNADVVRSPQHPDVRAVPALKTLSGKVPMVIGHRGDSGSRPEHTLEAYRSAIAKGADFIEPDLVVTKDGILIARHEPMLAVVQLDSNGQILKDTNGKPVLNTTDTSTDVFARPEFESRLTVKKLDGVLRGGWFAEDFTLSEVKQLNAIERIPGIRGTEYDKDQLKVPTLTEVIDLVKQVESTTGRKIGIYPETKHPSFFLQDGNLADGVTPISVNTSQLLVETLKATNFTHPSRVIIQSFEVGNLKSLATSIMPTAGIDVPLVQLFGGSGRPYDFVLSGDQRTYTDLSTASGLAEIKTYADGIGPNKQRILPQAYVDENKDGNRDDLNSDGVISDGDTVVGSPTSLIDEAHKAGLFVHLYTLRDDSFFLPSSYEGEAAAEFRRFIDLGVDGFFTDFPGTGHAVVVSQYLDGYGMSSSDQWYGGLIPSNIGGSGGFEGMAASPDGETLYPLLEKSVVGDPANSLRVYRFDTEQKQFTGLVGYYRMDKPTHAIGDFTAINNDEFIVIERDSTEGNPQGFKKLFKVNLAKVGTDGFIEKQEIANLMDIQDPGDLNKDGETRYSMPFVTIENVLVIDSTHVLVANDNNYPFSKGRPPEIDNNEVVILELETALDLDPRLGITAARGLAPNTITGTPENDFLQARAILSGIFNEFDARGDVVFTGAGDDEIDVAISSGFENRLFLGSGANIVYAGSRDVITGGADTDQIWATDGDANRLSGLGGADEFVIGSTGNRVLGGEGNDIIHVLADAGTNHLNGGAGADHFWLITGPGDLPSDRQVVMDFKPGEDVIGLRGAMYTNLDFYQTGSDSTLSVDGVVIGQFSNTSATALSNRANFTGLI
jgi:glycerophosphoryl diester phosphodiesterase